ncbi:hypothetical protein EFN92_03725 [Lactococcus lactis]|uniref:hypothetical protein n=1 Tax=Lactococcus lactis TaxID=1358 RepID=UPI0021A3D9DE|nr:hypothetical protein [Lactococcus lactis]MCT3091788.1 hypothetical protein [Lactococcus lactis]
MLTLSVYHADGQLVKAHSADAPHLAFKEYVYQPGDYITLTVDTVPAFYAVKFDEAFEESLVYLTEKNYCYDIVLDEELRRAFSPKTFAGERHYLTARPAKAEEICRRRNLALNPHDQKDCTGVFPHAYANVETRNDSTFFARNVIDGMVANESHGSFPYQSWGINQQVDAALTLDFGREVLIDELGLVLRGDYPHDSFWTQITVEFSDGSQVNIYPTDTLNEQKFEIPRKKSTKIILKNLIKNFDESPFPALTELTVYGFESDFDTLLA